MAIFTGDATAFNTTNRVLHDETVLLLSHSLKCHLYLEGNAPVVTNVVLTDTTPMSGGGYPGAATLTGNVVEGIAGKNWRFTANPIQFTAGAGGIIDAYWWAIWDDSDLVGPDSLVSFGRLDNTPGAVSAAQGDSIIINPHATDGFLKFTTTS